MSCSSCQTSNTPNNTVPFFVQYSSNDNRLCQQECTQNLNVLPNGPIIPTKPMFPSALPAEFSSYPSTLDTNYVTVRRQACICDLRVGCLTVDSGTNNSTKVRFRNLPTISSSTAEFSPIVVDTNGILYKGTN